MHFSEPITLAQLAELAHFSEIHFYRKFKQLFGMPPIEYLMQIRLRMAKFLLLDNNLNITDIARRTGYTNFGYFSVLFKRHFGVSPRDMRKGYSGDAGLQRRAEERRGRELARWLREGWQVALDVDFSEVDDLPPRLRGFWVEDYCPLMTTPHMAEVTDGLLHLTPNRVWTGITWEGELKEELKVEIVAVNSEPYGLNLAIAISGDLWHGYRLRLIGYQNIALETTSNGSWEVLHCCPVALDPYAREFHIVFWRSDNVFYAEVDGRRILAYHEPFAPQGMPHRCFAIARYYEYGSAALRVLRVCTRITPRYVDILEPGRAMLREGHYRSAFSWFQRVAEEHPEAHLQQEAAYLAALALPETEPEAKEAAFRQATADTASPFHQRLLRQWAFTRLGWGDIAGAVDLALRAARNKPDDDTPQVIAQRIVTAMDGALPALFEHALASLSRLPLTRLNLKSLPLESFAPLRGMTLRALASYASRVDDLSPLQGMPLEQLQLQYSAVHDLTPLAQMPLRELDCLFSDLRELTPLRGLALCQLNCNMNAIEDLSPLSGMPLDALYCAANRIHELWPLRGMPLRHFSCMGNAIADLAPLHGMPLHTLLCSHNTISDLTPLRGMPLQRLSCAANRITDLSPLRDFTADRVGLPRKCHCRPDSRGRIALAFA